MGNANALVQSEDWAALIADSKARNCYLDMNALPKEFAIPESSSHKLSGARSSRSGPRFRSHDMHIDSR